MSLVTENSIPALFKRRVTEQPNDLVYKFIDYDVDPNGFAETLTWAEADHRVQVVARRLLECGKPGDRVAVVAPQSLEYVIAFLGALQAGFLAVPLPVPFPGGLDERVAGALRDSAPVAILTTSAAAGTVAAYATGAPELIEVDALDFDSPLPAGGPVEGPVQKVAYLQYTSGSTRSPAGVMVTHENALANLGQIADTYLDVHDGGELPEGFLVSWLPFYHDMGLILGILGPLVVGRPSALMSPMSFLAKPARWLQQLALSGHSFTGGPNFAYELAIRRTTDADMAGLDLSGVMGMINGAERVHGSTVRRFNEKFAKFGLPEWAMRPSYGLAEATVYVVAAAGLRPPSIVKFDTEKLSAGHAEQCGEGGSELVGCGAPRGTSQLRVVDPETSAECPDGEVGEIWVHGPQVTAGYWHNPELTAKTFGADLSSTPQDGPRGSWLRTGDLGVFFDGELFVIGRIKDLLIVDGRNHYPDDIEITISMLSKGRVAAISVPHETTERLVAIVEVKSPGNSAESLEELRDLKRRILAAVNATHGVRVSDLVMVGAGSIPITSSGKVRRSECVLRYRSGDFIRVDATP